MSKGKGNESGVVGGNGTQTESNCKLAVRGNCRNAAEKRKTDPSSKVCYAKLRRAHGLKALAPDSGLKPL